MQKEIKYTGYSANPSDYECQDGDLAAILGLVNNKGAIRPVANPKEVITYPGKILFVHATSKFTHYIGLREYGDYLDWIDSTDTSVYHSITHSAYTGSEIIQVNAVGNTLVVLTTKGMFYYIWHGDDNIYFSLGNHIPELPIQFGLQGQYCEDESSTPMCSLEKPIRNASGASQFEVNEEDVAAVTNFVLGQANKFIDKFGTSVGRFVCPFFVRYAYRLFDGSLIMHSAPIFMQTASGVTPVVRGGAIWSGDASQDGHDADLVYASACGMVFDLDYNVLDSSLLTKLRTWSDVVKSVDIFVSAPIYRYKQDGENVTEVYTETNKGLDYGVYMMPNWDSQYSSIPKRYQKLPLYYAWNWCEGEFFSPMQRWRLPSFSDGEYNEMVSGRSAFYLLKSIPLEELSTYITKIDVDPDYLQSLVTREAMDDDYDSHDSLIPRFSFPYNSRLNLCDITKVVFDGFENGSAIQRTDGYVGPTSEDNDAPSTSNDSKEYVRVYVSIKKDGKTLTVVDSRTYSHAYNAPILYYYYPDTSAYQAVFAFYDENDSLVGYYKVNLTPHIGLNGAYFYSNGQSVKEAGTQVESVPSVSADLSIEIRNKIYTSEVNNPFIFPLLAINTVGNGRIIGLATAAKALSQGQFGQFPLYAFSSDGVWALEVSASTGAFSARQPITRDVCINVGSITQIDSAVLFATDRGIMLLSGSQALCITEGINNNGDPFNFSSLPLAANIKSALGITASETDELTEKPFLTYLLGCQMLYAYTRQLIIVFNPDYSYAYVYSLESKSWGIIKSGISCKVNSYPQAYAMSANGKLIDYSQEDGIPAHQFLITRPIKMDAGLKDVLKTVDTIIQRGYFTKGHVQTLLYGSRDLRNWFAVFSSQDHYLRGFRGTPYKYFRIALLCTLTHDESVWGATVQFTPRLTDQPR